MKKIDIRKENTIQVLNALIYKDKCINEIVNETGVGYQTVWEILKDLVAKGYVREFAPPKPKCGRRTNHYIICEKFNCGYIEEFEKHFSFISVDIYGRVIHRFDHYKMKNVPLDDDIRAIINKTRQKISFNDYSVGIFSVCSTEVNKRLPDNFIPMNKEDIIINAFGAEDKTVLFKIENKLYVSLFGNKIPLQNDVSEEDLNKIFKYDLIYRFNHATLGAVTAIERHALTRVLEFS